MEMSVIHARARLGPSAGETDRTNCQMQIKEMSAISADPTLLTASYRKPRLPIPAGARLLLHSLRTDSHAEGREGCSGKRVRVETQMEVRETPKFRRNAECWNRAPFLAVK